MRERGREKAPDLIDLGGSSWPSEPSVIRRATGQLICDLFPLLLAPEITTNRLLIRNLFPLLLAPEITTDRLLICDLFPLLLSPEITTNWLSHIHHHGGRREGVFRLGRLRGKRAAQLRILCEDQWKFKNTHTHTHPTGKYRTHIPRNMASAALASPSLALSHTLSSLSPLSLSHTLSSLSRSRSLSHTLSHTLSSLSHTHTLSLPSLSSPSRTQITGGSNRKLRGKECGLTNLRHVRKNGETPRGRNDGDVGVRESSGPGAVALAHVHRIICTENPGSFLP